MRPTHVEVDVESLDGAAQGIGRTDAGARARVRGALPGERVRMRVEHVGRDGTCYGVVDEVLRASDTRVDPECPHYLRCGGCELLHASRDVQAAYKRRGVAEALGRAESEVDPLVPSPRTFGYRALAKLVVGPGGALGSYRPRSHDVQDMVGCRVHAPEAEAVVDAVRSAMTPALQSELRYLLVRAALAEGRAVVTVVTWRAPTDAVRALADALGTREDVGRVAAHVNARMGDALWDPDGATVTLYDGGPVTERIGPVVQAVEPGAFIQVNPGAAAQLYALAVEGAAPAGQRVLDLYSGSGGLALALLAAGARRVLGVESVPAASAAAVAAAEATGVGPRFSARAGRVEDALAGVREDDVDVVVLNPPRKGAGDGVMQAILRLAPRRIVYVSCNPVSLAKDLAVLEGAGWWAARITPVDLFVHTRHVETVAVLTRG